MLGIGRQDASHRHLGPAIKIEIEEIYMLKISKTLELPSDAATQTFALLGRRGSGKALALDTPLPTPKGWTTMGDVKEGNYILDSLT
jgi:hypothetical protein